MEETDKKECSCDCSCCNNGSMHGGEHQHGQDWENKEWTKEELVAKKEKLEKKLAWVTEKMNGME